MMCGLGLTSRRCDVDPFARCMVDLEWRENLAKFNIAHLEGLKA